MVKSSDYHILAFYCFTSSFTLVFNKLALEDIPYPSLLTDVQLAFSAFSLLGARCATTMHIQALEWSHLQPSRRDLHHAMISSLGVYASMKALQGTQIITLILVRSFCPLLTSWLEWCLLGHALQPVSSWSALVFLLGGALCYVLAALYYSTFWTCRWSIVWLCIISVEMVHSKQLLFEARFSPEKVWKQMLISNALGMFPITLIGFLSGEQASISWHKVRWSPDIAVHLFLACACGASVGCAAWKSRSLMTAPAFVLVGVANKLMAALLSCLITAESTTITRATSLLVCLMASAVIQQPPMLGECGQSTCKMQQTLL